MTAGSLALGTPCYCKPFNAVHDGLLNLQSRPIRGLENKAQGPVEVNANAAYWNRIKKSLKPAVTLALVPSTSCCTLLYWA